MKCSSLLVPAPQNPGNYSDSLKQESTGRGFEKICLFFFVLRVVVLFVHCSVLLCCFALLYVGVLFCVFAVYYYYSYLIFLFFVCVCVFRGGPNRRPVDSCLRLSESGSRWSAVLMSATPADRGRQPNIEPQLAPSSKPKRPPVNGNQIE